MIGTLGDVVFEVADDHVLTFQDLQFTRSASYAEHKILGRDTLLEFTGRGAGSCSMKVVFDAAFGIDPKSQLVELERMMNDHEAVMFVLDGEPVGAGEWVIEGLNETIERADNFGGILRAAVSISMKEYIKA